MRRAAAIHCLLLAGLLGFGASTTATPAYSADHGILLAQKKKKKKKARPKSEEAFGPEGIGELAAGDDTGVGVHREQEGNDTPYWAEVSLNTDLSFLTSKVEGSDDKAVSSANYAVDVSWLFILGAVEVGPEFSLRSRTIAVPTTTFDETTQESKTGTLESTTSEFAIGGLFKLNFGDIDKDTLIFFGYGGAGYRQATTKVGDEDESKSSGMVGKVGGGLNLFLDSNVAFNPRGEFYYETDQAEKKEGQDEAPKTTTTGFRILVGIGVFI